MAKKFKYDLFLSHNRAQKDWVREVAKQLRALGLDVFFDEDTVEPGEPIITSLERGLQASRRVLLVLAPSAIKSKWVALERTITQHSDPSAVRKKLIPILLEPIPINKVPAAVRALNIIDLTNPVTRDERYAFVLKHLGIPEHSIPPPPWPRSKRGKKIVKSAVTVPKTSVRVKSSGSTKGLDGKNMILIRGDNDMLISTSMSIQSPTASTERF